MKCPVCGSATGVIESRKSHRRRECIGVGKHRFATIEALKTESDTIHEFLEILRKITTAIPPEKTLR